MARAREYRQDLRDRGEFTQVDFAAALPELLSEFRRGAYSALCDYIAERVDRESKDEHGSEEQGTLWPDYDLGGEFHIEGRRIAKRLAKLPHIDEWLAQDETNLAAVMTASARKHEQIARLRPYWGAEMSFAEAVTAYYEANPPAQIA